MNSLANSPGAIGQQDIHQAVQPAKRTCAEIVLHMAGLRTTRQRVALAQLLFAQHRHVTAEELFVEATNAGARLSLATVYNTLRHFRDAGLVRELALEGAKTYFDTNTSRHHHFYIEDEHTIIDIPEGAVALRRIPDAPDGMSITGVEVIVRVRMRSALPPPCER
jgi:Fur family iron response transcriptional regulator